MAYQRSQRVVGPAAALIDVNAARRWIRGTDEEGENEDLDLLIEAAMSHIDGADGILGRALITQTWADTWRTFPVGRRLPLALAPVQSVVSVEYFDTEGADATYPGSSFRLMSDVTGAFLELDEDSAWPSTDDRSDAVKITYVAGYGDTPSDVPAPLRLALREIIEQSAGLDDLGRDGALGSLIMSKLRRFIRPHF